MTPSVDLRLASMIRAMTDIVLPALRASDGLAREQAELVLGHLIVLRQQFDYALRYEQLELLFAIRLADHLLGLGGDCEAAQPHSDELRDAIASARAGMASRALSPGRVRDDLERLNAAIEGLVRSYDSDGDAAREQRWQRLIIDFAGKKSLRDRAMFVGMCFESADTTLPSIAQMMEEFEAECRGV